MRLTRNRRSAFTCGHRGFGAHCHRCAEGKRLEAIALGKEKPKGRKTKPSTFEGWTKDRFLEESKRLLGRPDSSS